MLTSIKKFFGGNMLGVQQYQKLKYQIIPKVRGVEDSTARLDLRQDATGGVCPHPTPAYAHYHTRPGGDLVVMRHIKTTQSEKREKVN